MKVISPLLGFNNNVKHKGRVFHIQTEDSGVRHPHVITHLFADGGRILKTLKTSYAEHLGGEGNVQETVRQLMKDQHKAMFIALRDGQFDHIFEDAPAAAASPSAPSAPAAPPVPAATPAAPEPAPEPAPPPPVVAAPPPPPVAATPPAPAVMPAAASAATPPPPPSSSSPVAPPPPSVPKFNLPRGPIPSVTMPKVDPSMAATVLRPAAPDPHVRPKGEGVELDLAMLEKAATAAETPFVQQTQDLSPPPNTVKKPGQLFTAGVYRALGTNEPHAPAPPSAGRYAQSRPPAIFASAKPTQGASIFGEDLISEKSLDEVILSYLAEDLEGDGA